jgi:hypothetical protein
MRLNTKKTRGGQLRALWKGLPDSLIPKAEKPKRLTLEDTNENYDYRNQDELSDPVRLVDRVRRGVKPMCTILIRRQREHFMTENAVTVTAAKMGMKGMVFFTRGGRRDAVVFLENVTLGQFYDTDDTIARYKGIGVELERDLFNTPLELLARPLVLEDFPADLKYPLMGMCFGYPVQETIDLLKGMKA